MLPPLAEGDRLQLRALRPEQKFTQPPARFTEATLVKELEENGIGRPSTYASIIGVLQDRDYVNKSEGRFKPTSGNGAAVERAGAIAGGNGATQGQGSNVARRPGAGKLQVDGTGTIGAVSLSLPALIVVPPA